MAAIIVIIHDIEALHHLILNIVRCLIIFVERNFVLLTFVNRVRMLLSLKMFDLNKHREQFIKLQFIVQLFLRRIIFFSVESFKVDLVEPLI